MDQPDAAVLDPIDDVYRVTVSRPLTSPGPGDAGVDLFKYITVDQPEDGNVYFTTRLPGSRLHGGDHA